MRIPIRVAQNKQMGRMRPAGRQFEMSGLRTWFIFEEYWNHENSHYIQTCEQLKPLEFNHRDFVSNVVIVIVQEVGCCLDVTFFTEV